MAETAYQVQYRQEYIAEFEQTVALLPSTTTTEAVIKGNQATFLVAGSGGATAVTRGVNGLIPPRALSNTQTTATLVEWHDLPRTTEFNIFASQGDQRQIMQKSSIATMNRKRDLDIITELNTGTVNTGAAVTATLMLFMKSKTILGNADIPWDMNITGLITPAFEAYLSTVKEFSSAEYVTKKVFDMADPAWRDQPVQFFWKGVVWIVHPNLPGAGTSAEKCFLYHKNAIGHAVNKSGMDIAAGYNDEQNYSWARTSCFMGTQILQNAGVVIMNHDGSALVAA